MIRVWSIALLLVAGCGPKVAMYPVTGTVEFRGQPLNTGVVAFHHDDGVSPIAKGDIQSDGSFALETFKAGDGAVAGTYAAQSEKPKSKSERLGIGAIGLRYQGSVIAHKAQMYGDIVAVCDVDRHVRDQAKAAFGSTAQSFEDYRDLLARKDVDVVTIGTPDHWHTKMVIDACRAGKDVYCEKPLTLTIDEGKKLAKVIKETGRVVQVGSWQRSDERFRLAVEMVSAGRIGKLQKVEIVLGKNGTSSSFVPRVPPAHLNWDLWQGQTCSVPYIEERTHYTFRWWYEYSGGQMTDWGAITLTSLNGRSIRIRWKSMEQLNFRKSKTALTFRSILKSPIDTQTM